MSETIGVAPCIVELWIQLIFRVILFFFILFICVGFILGFASIRNPNNGSRYVQMVVNVFMEDACNSDIETMLKKVYFSGIKVHV